MLKIGKARFGAKHREVARAAARAALQRRYKRLHALVCYEDILREHGRERCLQSRFQVAKIRGNAADLVPLGYEPPVWLSVDDTMFSAFWDAHGKQNTNAGQPEKALIQDQVRTWRHQAMKAVKSFASGIRGQ